MYLILPLRFFAGQFTAVDGGFLNARTKNEKEIEFIQKTEFA